MQGGSGRPAYVQMTRSEREALPTKLFAESVPCFCDWLYICSQNCIHTMCLVQTLFYSETSNSSRDHNAQNAKNDRQNSDHARQRFGGPPIIRSVQMMAENRQQQIDLSNGSHSGTHFSHRMGPKELTRTHENSNHLQPCYTVHSRAILNFSMLIYT